MRKTVPCLSDMYPARLQRMYNLQCCGICVTVNMTKCTFAPEATLADQRKAAIMGGQRRRASAPSMHVEHAQGKVWNHNRCKLRVFVLQLLSGEVQQSGCTEVCGSVQFCEPGRYGLVEGGSVEESACGLCSDGMFSEPSRGIGECRNCPAGFYLKLGSAKILSPCVPGLTVNTRKSKVQSV